MIGKIILITIIVLACLLWFGFIFGMMFSPKVRSKFMGHQLKMQKQMLEDNEEDLRNIATKGADISKGAVTTTAKAIKEGLTDEEIYCKHCGTSIDSDSTFCKKCGKEQ